MVFNFSTILRVQRLVHPRVGPIARWWHSREIPVRWRTPDSGYVKLNVDGASKGKLGDASIGGLVRNHKAEFLVGYAEPIGKTSGFMAECTALKRGLEIVLENGWCNVWLEGDSMSLMEILANRNRTTKSMQYMRVVKDIKLMIPELKYCIVSHIYREGNRAADKLAGMGYRLDGLQIWRDEPPEEVLRIVREDAEGKIILRRK